MTTASHPYRTPHQVAELGFRALVASLGAGGALDFMLQYEPGEGDYTKERQSIVQSFRLEGLAARTAKRRRATPRRRSRLID